MIPDGQLLRSKVIMSLSPALSDVLDRRLDGYALISSQGMLFDDEDETAVITFEAGVPVLAYHSKTDRGGPPALDDIGPPPYLFELYALEATALELPHRTAELRVSPDALATQLAGDPELASRTRGIADDTLGEVDEETVEAFLEDAAAIEDIRQTAREEALERADEWNLEAAVDERTSQ